MTRSLMVTGGAGFIGVNFVYHWANACPDDQLVVLDALTYAGARKSGAARAGRSYRVCRGRHLRCGAG